MTDEQALERLEALRGQQLNSRWRPLSDYSWEARKDFEIPQAHRIVTLFQPLFRILDVGCGHGHLMKALALADPTRSIRIEGLDSVNRIDGMPLCFYQDNISNPALFEDSAHSMRERRAELVTCREVLEHLSFHDVVWAVRNLCKLSRKWIYVTTRYAKDPDHFLDVDTADDLDPTHCTMLNQGFLRMLFVLEGFKRRADLETAMDWKNLGRVLVYERA